MATGGDKTPKIDCWAKLFEATIWEKVKMRKENNTYPEVETKYVSLLK